MNHKVSQVLNIAALIGMTTILPGCDSGAKEINEIKRQLAEKDESLKSAHTQIATQKEQIGSLSTQVDAMLTAAASQPKFVCPDKTPSLNDIKGPTLVNDKSGNKLLVLPAKFAKIKGDNTFDSLQILGQQGIGCSLKDGYDWHVDKGNLVAIPQHFNTTIHQDLIRKVFGIAAAAEDSGKVYVVTDNTWQFKGTIGYTTKNYTGDAAEKLDDFEFIATQ
ncbi:MAG: hypothetical protein WBK77_04815 [Alphaproteobacteria bacterium]